RFRQDLLYRLEVIGLRVPALREREADVRKLAFHFLHDSAARHGKTVERITDQALAVLEGHLWPGNIRELSNVIERAVIFAMSEELTLADLPPHLMALSSQLRGEAPGDFEKLLKQKIEVALGTPLKDVEELLIRKTLEATDGDKNMTARLLGINSRTIYRRLDGKKPLESPTSPDALGLEIENQ
ncbi:MAG TPA: hypothetical protein DCS07_17375, partial [Bdellovibrionales bacterium]|nr:hypothetical protein [Bdellovibrionales bacterium]